ncbi:MAG: hypothetical protein KDA49_18795 [Rhodospirillaceae bacterium]|nr:hypothetical protein [Rhodospirillaceae bacterium]
MGFLFSKPSIPPAPAPPPDPPPPVPAPASAPTATQAATEAQDAVRREQRRSSAAYILTGRPRGVGLVNPPVTDKKELLG